MAGAAAPVIGRAEELEEIATALFGDGPPQIVLIDGEPGIGKTTIWEHAVADARRRGWRVLRARPAGSDALLDYSGLGDILDECLESVAGRLPSPQRRALSVALLREDPDGAPPDRRAVAAAFLSALRALAEQGPVLVAVDDLQWLDAPSADVLAYAARRLGTEPVGLLLAQRPDPVGRVPFDLGAALAPDRLHVLPVGPLGLSAAYRLVVERLGIACSRPVMRRIHEASGGNAFYVLELAGALERSGVDPGGSEPLPMPGSLRDLIGERLAGLPEATRRALGLTALASQPTVSLVTAATGEDGWAALRPAAAAGVVTFEEDRIRFGHPLLASAVQADVDLGERRRLHGLLATTVADVEAAAWHRALATERPEAAVAAVVEEAANRALRRGAHQSAAALLEQALRLTPMEASTLRCTRLVAAARACIAAGDSRHAGELLGEAVTVAAPGSERAGALATLVGLEFGTLGVGAALATADAALAEAEAAGDIRLQAVIHAELAELARFGGGGIQAAGQHALKAVAFAEQAGDPLVLRRALTAQAVLHFNAGGGMTRPALAQASALPAGDAEEELAPELGLAHQLLWAGELEEARALLTGLCDRIAGDDIARNEPLWYLSLVEFRLGAWAEAERLAKESHALIAEAGRESEEGGLSLQPLVLIAAHRGALEDATALASRGLDLAYAAGLRTCVAQYRGLFGFIALCRDDPSAAIEHLQAALDQWVELGIGEPGMVMGVVADLVDALVLAGRPAEAAEMLAPWAERTQELDRPAALASVRRGRAQIAAASGDIAAAREAVLAAIDVRDPEPFSRARTMLVAGAIHRRARQKRLARDALQQALDSFARLGAPLWAARARHELTRIGGRAAATGELTAAERRVAALVAEGGSTKQVAATLFCSPKTVEGHLSRIYGKLGVRSRTELARALRQSQGESPVSPEGPRP